MPRASWSPEPDCAIANALAVVGDWWTLLIVRDIARGYNRFDGLAAELKISRRVLAERLIHLTEHEVLSRQPYQDNPIRYRYELTERGRALLPVLVTLQDWGDRWLLGDGAVTGTASPRTPQAHRVRELVRAIVPPLSLPASQDNATVTRDLIDDARKATVVFAYAATSRPGPVPDGYWDVPGTAGCTLENRLFRDRYDEFRANGIAVHGLSSQRPDEQRAFAAAEDIPFPLFSDQHQRVAAALRLPTFRVADTLRLKRLVLVVNPRREIVAARFPVTDIAAAVQWAQTVASAVRVQVP